MDYEFTCKTAQNITNNKESELRELCELIKTKGETNREKIWFEFLTYVRKMNLTMNLSEIEHISAILVGWCYIKNYL